MSKKKKSLEIPSGLLATSSDEFYPKKIIFNPYSKTDITQPLLAVDSTSEKLEYKLPIKDFVTRAEIDVLINVLSNTINEFRQRLEKLLSAGKIFTYTVQIGEGVAITVTASEEMRDEYFKRVNDFAGILAEKITKVLMEKNRREQAEQTRGVYA